MLQPGVACTDLLLALNSGTCLFAFWAALTTIVLLVNSIMWYGSTRAFADEWCDVCEQIFRFGKKYCLLHIMQLHASLLGPLPLFPLLRC